MTKLLAMIFVLLCILSSTAIFLIFKYIGYYRVNTFSAIIVNYIVACSAGFFLSDSNVLAKPIFTYDWFKLSILIGFLFISVFWLIGKSTQKAGVAVTSVAGKMSVIVPISYSIWLDANDRLTLLKSMGIILALLAVFLTTFREEERNREGISTYLPLFIFIGIGIIDSFIKYAQATYIDNQINPLFSASVFGLAGLTGIAILTINHKAARDLIRLKTLGLGILLGLANFGSVYFMIGALNHIDTSTGQQAEGSIIFGINNIAIVVLSVLLGFFFFKERLTRLNWGGIALSVVAIVILMHS